MHTPHTYESALRLKSLALLEDIAHWQMTTQARQLVTVLDNCHKAGFNSNQPRIPAGQPSGGQWTEVTSENYQAISKWERWGDAETLQRHYVSSVNAVLF